jgi:hypothetical protein
MPPEVLKRCALIIEARPSDACHPLRVQSLADEGGPLVRDPVSRERDGLEDDMISRDQQVGEAAALEFAEEIDHPLVMAVGLAEEGEEEARIDEDHSSRPP